MKLGDLLKLIPLVGTVVGVVERFVNKPTAPKADRDPNAAKKAKKAWEDAKRGL